MTEQPAAAKALADQEVERIAIAAAKCAVQETFTKLGVDTSGPDSIIEVQKDFAFLRGRRLLELKIRVKAIVTLITVVVVGTAAMIWAVVSGRSGP